MIGEGHVNEKVAEEVARTSLDRTIDFERGNPDVLYVFSKLHEMVGDSDPTSSDPVTTIARGMIDDLWTRTYVSPEARMDMARSLTALVLAHHRYDQNVPTA